MSLASSPSFTRCIVNFQNPNAIFMFWLRYKFGALEVTKRVGEDWGWVVQLEVGIGNQDHPGWRSLWWWSEGGGNFTIAICNSSGGLPKAGDYHHLIGKEQSRLKGEHGTSTIHCQDSQIDGQVTCQEQALTGSRISIPGFFGTGFSNIFYPGI